MKKIAIIGECMIELNGKPFGEMHQTFGGDTLNAAIYLSRGCKLNTDEQPIEIFYISAMGTDPLSEAMVARWKEEGINADHVLQDNTRTPGLYLIQLDDRGERTFLYWRNQSPARYLLQHPEFECTEQFLTQVDMVFVSGISLAILPEEDRTKLLNLLGVLRSQGVEVAFDSNYRQALWPNDDLHTVRGNYQSIYKTSDLALVTFDDEQHIWGDKTPQDCLERLHAHGIDKVVVKLGAEGCLVGEASQGVQLSVPTTSVDNVVDTTSAGDSFNGGFLSSYLVGGNLIQSCQRGNTLAGVVIQHSGAIVPTAVTDLVTDKLS